MVNSWLTCPNFFQQFTFSLKFTFICISHTYIHDLDPNVTMHLEVTLQNYTFYKLFPTFKTFKLLLLDQFG